jgi:predicted permease
MELIRPVRQLVRRFGRAPSFTAICVLTLALGIGATTAMYAVVDGVLLEPLPYPAQDRLVGVWHEAPGLGFDEVNQSPALHAVYRDDGRVFEDIGMWSNTQVTVTGLGEPEQIDGLRLTDGTLRLLGATPVRGRIFSAEDDTHGAPLTAMLSWDYWQTRLGGDANVVGRTLTVDGRAREIIGVLPRDFRVLDRDASIFLPLQFDPAQIIVGNFSYQGLARLRPGVTIAQANADMARLIAIAPERYPGALTSTMLTEARFAPAVRPLHVDVVGDIGNLLWVLLGTVAIVLLIACANVANLFLVRAEGRYRDVAVRAALGASRARIAREFLAEGVGMAIVAGALAVGIAAAGLRLLRALGAERLPRLEDIAIDASVLLVAFLLSVVAGALLSIVPIVRHGGDRLAGALREGGRGGSAGRERHRARSVLVVAQLALALLLLAGSGLMIRSALAMRNVDPGFTSPETLLTMRLAIPGAEVPEPEAVVAMHERIAQQLAAVPGVAAVGMSSAIPMDGNNSNDPIDFEEFQVPSGQLAPIRRYNWIAPGFFSTIGTPLVAGRDFTWDDIRSHRNVVILSESLVRQHYDDPRQAIGKRVRNIADSPWREIIGVAADVHADGLDQDPTMAAYWPLLVQDLWGPGVDAQWSLGYALRLDRPLTPALMSAVRTAVWSVNANLPLANVRALDELVDRSMARTTFTLVMLGIASALALVLGAVGLYGVISYAVAQRTREFGVRMALGARRGDVGRLVLHHAGVLVAIGVAAGLLAALGLTRLMSAMLFGVAPADPVTFGAVALVLAIVALVASLVPVLRATRVDPLEALRWE